MPNSDSPPTDIRLRRRSRLVEVVFADAQYAFSFEYLRTHSPSAEVQGHGPGQKTLQTGKRDVLISALDPVGHYAVKPVFSDGHDTGIYAWPYLYELGIEHDRLWATYLAELEHAGASR
jgi:DUF971 family protein